MNPRIAIYNRMVNDPELQALVGGRVFAKKSMTSAVEEHPFIVYKFGTGSNEDLAEDEPIKRQYLQFFVHDFSDTETGDYLRIDDVLSRLYQLFHNWSNKEANIILTSFLETSQDLNDLTLSTVMKYSRFNSLIKETP